MLFYLSIALIPISIFYWALKYKPLPLIILIILISQNYFNFYPAAYKIFTLYREDLIFVLCLIALLITALRGKFNSIYIVLRNNALLWLAPIIIFFTSVFFSSTEYGDIADKLLLSRVLIQQALVIVTSTVLFIALLNNSEYEVRRPDLSWLLNTVILIVLLHIVFYFLGSNQLLFDDSILRNKLTLERLFLLGGIIVYILLLCSTSIFLNSSYFPTGVSAISKSKIKLAVAILLLALLLILSGSRGLLLGYIFAVLIHQIICSEKLYFSRIFTLLIGGLAFSPLLLLGVNDVFSLSINEFSAQEGNLYVRYLGAQEYLARLNESLLFGHGINRGDEQIGTNFLIADLGIVADLYRFGVLGFLVQTSAFLFLFFRLIKFRRYTLVGNTILIIMVGVITIMPTISMSTNALGGTILGLLSAFEIVHRQKAKNFNLTTQLRRKQAFGR